MVTYFIFSQYKDFAGALATVVLSALDFLHLVLVVVYKIQLFTETEPSYRANNIMLLKTLN